MTENKIMLGHLQTIYPTLFRKVSLRDYERERITTPDNDFLDLDWLKQNSKKVVIISHGLEGNTHRAYVKGMAKAFYNDGYDVLAWNFRGCGGGMNKALRFYHSGATDDLSTVVDHAIHLGYETILLIGFSLGGNLSLKYGGERALNSKIKGIIAFSVPMHLYSCSLQLSKPSNWIYANRFLKSLKNKITEKSKVMPELMRTALREIKTLQQFDDAFTGPLHGFKDAIDYYQKCSALFFLEGIKIPTLIVNAQNDPFLSVECFPASIKNNRIKFKFPKTGGHVGFFRFLGNGLYSSESWALEFARTIRK